MLQIFIFAKITKIMERVTGFLSLLSQNNNKEWFDVHKSQYKEALEVFQDFTTELINGIATFDKAVSGLSVKDCTFRIYRDLRFSPDKTPYKTYMGAYVCPGGKKSGFAGYYFHIGAAVNDWSGHNFMSSGLYQAHPAVVKSVRDDILYDATPYLDAIALAEGFEIDFGGCLKRVPAGYPSDSPFEHFFRLKDFLLARYMDDEFILDKNLLRKVLSGFKKTHTFVDLLNRSVSYANTSQN